MISEVEKYVQEILKLIYRKDDYDQLLFDLSLLIDRLGYNTVSKGKSENPDERKDIIRSHLKSIDSEILFDFLKELIDKNDHWLFEPAHFKIFVEQMEEVGKKMAIFNLTAAIKIEEEDLQKISIKLSKRMEKKVVINLSVDKSLVGGAVIKKDNYIMDYSLKTKLSTFSSQWKKAIQQVKETDG